MRKERKIQNLDDIVKKREDILSIASSHGAFNIRVFGSYIRGEQKPDSDLDLLADIDCNKSLLDQAALIRELEEFLDLKVDLVEPTCLHWYIKDIILKEAVPL
jgi:hypothetical protein